MVATQTTNAREQLSITDFLLSRPPSPLVQAGERTRRCLPSRTLLSRRAFLKERRAPSPAYWPCCPSLHMHKPAAIGAGQVIKPPEHSRAALILLLLVGFGTRITIPPAVSATTGPTKLMAALTAFPAPSCLLSPGCPIRIIPTERPLLYTSKKQHIRTRHPAETARLMMAWGTLRLYIPSPTTTAVSIRHRRRGVISCKRAHSRL